MPRRSSRLVLLAGLGAMLAMTVAGNSPPSGMLIALVDVARQAGLTLRNVCGGPIKNYLLETVGSGAAFFDFDGDGDIDVLLVNGSTLPALKRGGHAMLALYRNDGRGRFNDVTSGSGLEARGWGMGVCIADYDNDGLEDVYVTAYGAGHLFKNLGRGRFSDVTERAGLGAASWSTGCAFGDYDRDGDVDLYVANYVAFDESTSPKRGDGPECLDTGVPMLCGPMAYRGQPDVLYRNNGDGTFTNGTERAGIRDPGYHGFGVLFSDLDDDGWLDIYVANDTKPNLFFLNNRDGTFSEVGLVSGAALDATGRALGSMGVDAGDFDRDGRLDVFVSNFVREGNTLYLNEGKGLFRDVSSAAGLATPSLAYVGWGTSFVDFDNDGLLDIFVANGHIQPEVDQLRGPIRFRQRKTLYRNRGDGRFDDVTDQVGGGLLLERASRGAAFGDFDDDGDIDVLVINLDDTPTLLRNDGGNRRHWLTLKLVADGNRNAIGARVTLEAGGAKQTAEVRSGGSFLSHNDSRVHFGLGEATRAERLEIRWPSGAVQTFEDVPADQFLVAREASGITRSRR